MLTGEILNESYKAGGGIVVDSKSPQANMPDYISLCTHFETYSQ